MIKCISAIYVQIADPPLFSYDYPFSPISLSSSSSVQQGQNDLGILQCEESSSNSTLNNPFHIKETGEFNRSFVTMTEVQGLCRDKRSLDGVDRMLQHFRSVILPQIVFCIFLFSNEELVLKTCYICKVIWIINLMI